MAKSVRARVKPKLLIWARESAGYSIAEAAKRLGVPEERVTAWEEGTLAPTVRQLQTLSDAYKRPLSVFYLQEAPKTFKAMHDFRRLPGSRPARFSPQLVLEIRLARQRRQLALELLDETGDEAPEFAIGANLSENPELVGDRILRALAITQQDRAVWYRDRAGYAAFNAWRARIEDKGVLVFQTTRVESDEVSGIAIAEKRLPVIVVNRSGIPPTRRTFSLLHEFVHLMLQRSGVSDLEIDEGRRSEDDSIEIFCNHAAAAALMPRNELLSDRLVQNHDPADATWSDEIIVELARTYSVSREALVRRLLTFKLTTESFYRKKRVQYAKEFVRLQAIQREAYKHSTEFRVNPPRETISNFGTPLVRMILESYYRDRMTLSDVSGYLGVRTRHVPTLEHIVKMRSIA